MSIHTKFLIWWTGKSFLHDTDEQRQRYVERLKDTCQNGLYMNRGVESLFGVKNTYISIPISRVCFTEVRLTQAQTHADRYGKLGIGFDRDFVLEREGNPVLYVQNGDKGHIIEILAVLHDRFQTEGHPLLNSIRLLLGGYLKGMSDRNDPDLKYYEEMEWRIVIVDRLLKTGIYSIEDEQAHIYRLNVTPTDFRVIVLPDSETKHLVVEDAFLNEYFQGNWPILLTLGDCKHF